MRSRAQWACREEKGKAEERGGEREEVCAVRGGRACSVKEGKRKMRVCGGA